MTGVAVDSSDHHVRLKVSVSEDRVYLGDWDLFGGDRIRRDSEISALRSSNQPELVVTANVDHVVKLQRDPKFREAYALASLRLVDGTPLAWLMSRVSRGRVRRHTGADLLLESTDLASRHGWKIAILGGDPLVGLAAAERLQDRGDDFEVVHISVPHVDRSAVTMTVNEKLSDEKPDLVFICLGAPKQELWFVANRPFLPPAVYIGAGAAVDFAAGVKSRAPKLLQFAGLEWVYRLAQEPSRLARRYLIEGPRFLGVIARSIQPKSAA